LPDSTLTRKQGSGSDSVTGSLAPRDERPLCPLTPRNSTTDYRIELRFIPCGSATPVMTQLVMLVAARAVTQAATILGGRGNPMRRSIIASTFAAILFSLSANATVIYYACVTNSNGDIVIVSQNTSCPTGQTKIHWNQIGPKGPQGPQGPPGTAGSGIWYGGSNLGNLTTTPTSIIQPSPQITVAGSYMVIANVSLQEILGGYPTVTCFVEVGSTNLLPSITTVQSSTAMNLTTTGAITLTTADVPALVSLLCSYNNNGAVSVPHASLSIIQVGTLQTGP
jgi:hypothetical protein